LIVALLLVFPCCRAEQQLSRGLTHVFTTPILRDQLVDEQSAMLSTLTELVLRRFYTVQHSECSDLEDDETVNDRFFTIQQRAFEDGEPSFLVGHRG